LPSANFSQKKVGIIACGEMVSRSLFCVKELEESGVEVGILNLHTIKPIDEKAILEFVKKYKNILTCEEHQIAGGMGSAVLECLVKLNQENLQNGGENIFANLNFEMIGVDNRFGQSGTKEELFKEYGLEEISILEKIKSLLEI
jgi:transketolase